MHITCVCVCVCVKEGGLVNFYNITHPPFAFGALAVNAPSSSFVMDTKRSLKYLQFFSHLGASRERTGAGISALKLSFVLSDPHPPSGFWRENCSRKEFGHRKNIIKSRENSPCHGGYSPLLP